MKYLTDTEEQVGVKWMLAAGHVAEKALCLKAHCGTVIIKDGEVIGEGYNAPPLDDPANCTCADTYDYSGKAEYDRTCCMHAEWRAILDACRRNPDKLEGSQLFFSRVDKDGHIKKAGEPYCTVCSRFALDVGIAEFLLWKEQGICAYPTDEYNKISYSYRSS